MMNYILKVDENSLKNRIVNIFSIPLNNIISIEFLVFPLNVGRKKFCRTNHRRDKFWTKGGKSISLIGS